MLKTVQKLFALFLIVGLVVAAAVKVAPVQAAQVRTASVTLSDPTAGATGVTHTFSFTLPTASTTLSEIRFEYYTGASSGSIVSTIDTDGSSLGSLTGLNAGWTLNNSSNGTLKLQHVSAGGQNISANTVIGIPVSAITNSSMDTCQAGGDTSSDTCFIRITTYSDLGTTVVDQTIITYTVVTAVTVSARVDPTFTFVVAAVGASTVNNAITTSAASTFSTLPFGNLTASTPKYLAHKLNVTTNTNSGYTVTMKMLSQMSGNYTANNIDPFAGTGATWSNPIGWTEPTGGTPNTNTGWIGANTTDTDISGGAWSSASEKFGPANNSENTVMQDTDSDNGSTAIYVTYAVEANVFQPSDTYSGTLVYNAIPTY